LLHDKSSIFDIPGCKDKASTPTEGDPCICVYAPPLVLQYLTPNVPPGIQAGGIFVNKNAEKFFNAEFLRAGCDISDARIATEEFEKEKKRFINEREGLKLRVGNSKMNIHSIKLKRGYLALTGWAVELF
jgi:hypothetical protein